jgi:hypothetical protein
MRFTAEQQQHIEARITRRLIADRRMRAIEFQALIVERDRLTVELARTREVLNTYIRDRRGIHD